MKIGEIIEVEGVKYIAQTEQSDEKSGCSGCCFDGIPGECYTKFRCNENKIILVKIPLEILEKIEQLEKQIELMKNCDNCGNANFGENCKKCLNLSRWEMWK